MKLKAIGGLAALFCIFLAAPGISPAAEVVTLTQAIEIAVKKNPSLDASRSEVAAAQAGITQAAAAYYPQVNATAGYDHTWRDAGGGTPGTVEADAYGAGLSVDQTLFDFGKTAAQVERSTHGLAASVSDQRTAHNTLVRAVKSAYFEALKKQQLLTVGQEALTVREQHLEQARALYRQGMRPKIDMIRSEAERSQAQLSLISARYGQRRAIKALETLLGGPPVAGDYALSDEVPPSQPVPALDELVVRAHDRRPEPAAVQAQIRAARAGLLAIEKSARPGLSANGAYNTTGDDFPLDHRWQVGVSLTWPLFTGYRQTGQVAQYQAEVDRLNALLAERLLAVTEEVTQAVLGVHEAREAITAAEVSLTHAEENLALARGRYGAGVSDAIEFSDAQVLYTEAKSAWVQAVYDLQIAMADLEYAVGGIEP